MPCQRGRFCYFALREAKPGKSLDAPEKEDADLLPDTYRNRIMDREAFYVPWGN